MQGKPKPSEQLLTIRCQKTQLLLSKRSAIVKVRSYLKSVGPSAESYMAEAGQGEHFGGRYGGEGTSRGGKTLFYRIKFNMIIYENF